LKKKNQNGFATLDDFRKMREAQPTESVKLPKLGKHVLLRRPTPLWFMYFDKLPKSLAAKAALAKGEKNVAVTPEETQEGLLWLKRVLEETMVEPKCTDELLNLIDFEDALFISTWAHGEILGVKGEEAKSLETFRAGREPADARATG
jgi:hypothetical protein